MTSRTLQGSLRILIRRTAELIVICFGHRTRRKPVSDGRLSQICYVEKRRMAKPRCHQFLDLPHGLNSASRADAHAVQRCGGAGKIENTRKLPALQQTIDEAGVECVTRAGGINRVYLKCRSVVELFAIPGEHAVLAESRGREDAIESTLHERQCFFEIAFIDQPRGDITADDGVVDLLQQAFDSGVNVIKIGDDWNAGGACPDCGQRGCFRVVAIYVKSASIYDPLAIELVRTKTKLRVASPEYSALAVAIDQNDSLLTRASGHSDDLRVNSRACELGAMQPG